MPKTEKQLAIFALMAEQDANFNPIKKLVELATTSVDPTIQLNASKELAGYCYAKRRPEDSDGKAGGDLIVQVVKFVQNEITPGQPMEELPKAKVIDVQVITEELENEL